VTKTLKHRPEVVGRFPHPGRGFTQGLIIEGDQVWESTGLYGASSLRCYRLGSDTLTWSAALDPGLFGEGICRIGSSLWQLTWKEGVALRWCPGTRTLQGTIPLEGQGWGACHMDTDAGARAVTTHGTDAIVIRDPLTLHPLRTLHVTWNGSPVTHLNDLTYAGGRLWANVWRTPYLLGICPDTGHVIDEADAAFLADQHVHGSRTCLNGIAALPEPGHFLLTGKQWPALYRVRLRPTPG
jgi:glutamine cyclotransferase